MTTIDPTADTLPAPPDEPDRAPGQVCRICWLPLLPSENADGRCGECQEAHALAEHLSTRSPKMLGDGTYWYGPSHEDD